MYQSKLRMRQHYEKKYFLRDNPFSITPSIREILWANRVHLRERLEGIIETSLSTSPSRIIINWGDWGSGKTHAMNYLSSELFRKRVQEKLKAKVDFLSCAFYLPKPTSLGSMAELLYQEIVSRITVESLHHRMVLIRKELIDRGYEELQVRKEIMDYIQRLSRRTDFAEVFTRLIGKRLTESVKRFLLGGRLTSTELKELGVIREIESLSDMLDAISLFTQLLTQPFEEVSEQYLETFIWIDESEALRHIGARDVFIFRNFIRDLLDYAPSDVTVFLNFSLSPGEPYSTVEDQLGRAVISRVDENVEFPLMTKTNECLDYISELLQHFRTTPKRNRFLPFSKEAVDYIIGERIKKGWLPRELNNSFSKALEIGVAKNRKVLDVDFLRKNEKTILPKLQKTAG